MARTVIKLEEEEVIFFHLNYTYMWKKLNTAPYYVSGSGEIPSWIHEPWLLPSYVNLSKCLNPEFVPSMNIVNKIVQFYNANIQPEVDSFAFLHEKLESTDNMRRTNSGSDTEKYCGLYNCYYYSGITTKKEIYGAVMKVQRVHDSTSVQMITGLTTDADMRTPQLMELFNGRDIPLEKYKEYRNKLELSKRRTTLYKGTVSLVPGIMSLQMQSEDRAGSMISLRIPVIENSTDDYLGSIALLSLIGGTEVQILKMGIMRADRKELHPISLETPALHEILAMQKMENEHVTFNFNDNVIWNDIMLSNS